VQLFLVPGLLVAAVVAFIWVFFGWLGTGTQDADKLLSLVESSPSDLQRWKSAQDLAQLLPRDQELRCNVRYALRVAEVLDRERQRPLPPPQDETAQREQTPDMLKFLPAVAAHFYVPVGLPAMQATVADTWNRTRDEMQLLRLRNAIVAIGNLGARMQEYDQLPQETKDQMLAVLKQEAGDGPGRPTWARLALNYLERRDRRLHTKADQSDLKEPFGVIATLSLGARAMDELTRGYTVLALANWDEPAADPILRQLAGDQSDLPDEAFAKDDKEPLTKQDRERGEREIRYTAALSMAKRGSALTPWELVLETLNEDGLRKRYSEFDGSRRTRRDANAETLAAQCTAKALRDLQELKRTNPKVLEEQKEVAEAVQRLATGSNNMVVKVEAQKLLGGSPETSVLGARMSREVLLIIGLGVGVLVLLGLGVFARWRRGGVAHTS
jgi:hypothetical protein